MFQLIALLPAAMSAIDTNLFFYDCNRRGKILPIS